MGFEQGVIKVGQSLRGLGETWPLRFREANHLLDGRFGCGAVLAYIYALEIRLKVGICDHLDLESLPKGFEVYDLEALMILVGLQRRINDDETMRPHWTRLLPIWRLYQHARYRPGTDSDLADADEVRTLLTDPDLGVISWLSKHRPHETPP